MKTTISTKSNKISGYKKLILTKKEVNESQISEIDKLDIEKIREAM